MPGCAGWQARSRAACTCCGRTNRGPTWARRPEAARGAERAEGRGGPRPGRRGGELIHGGVLEAAEAGACLAAQGHDEHPGAVVAACEALAGEPEAHLARVLRAADVNGLLGEQD